jgi:putative ABC transport system permease protein
VSESQADAAISDITTVLREQHKLAPKDEDDFQVRSQQETLEMMDSITGFLTTLLASIAFISLIVGGIGIMNIMYVTVTERTKEIGLRMAIGAHKKDILLQFLFESTILSLIGGVIGIVFGLTLSYVISVVFLHWPFMVSVPSIAVSFLFCAATGIFFGWFPAQKAASLDPITALRYE